MPNARDARIERTSAMRGIDSGATASSSMRRPSRRRADPSAPPALASTRLSVSSCAEQAPAAGAERAAHGELAPAPRAARQQQARDVGAGDQQHEADRAEQHQQRARARRRPAPPAAARPSRPRPRWCPDTRARGDRRWPAGPRGLARPSRRAGAVRRPGSTARRAARERRLRWRPARSAPLAAPAPTDRHATGWTNAAGMTPMTVVGMPLSRIVLPTTSVARPRCVSHSASEITATRGPAGASLASRVGAAGQRRQTEHVEERGRGFERGQAVPDRRGPSDRRRPRDSRRSPRSCGWLACSRDSRPARTRRRRSFGVGPATA